MDHGPQFRFPVGSMLTAHSFAARQTKSWFRTLSLLGGTFICYFAWAISVFDEKKIVSPRHVSIQLDEALSLGLVITMALLAFGAWQYVSQRQEIERRIIAERRARHLAYHDSLTGLANRRSLEEELTILTTAVFEHDPIGAVLMLDFDHFKEINDVHGHGVGDEFLKTVAARMRQVVQNAGTVSRLGGDEFAIILKIQDWPSAALDVASRVIAAISEPMEINGVELTAEVSIGVVEIPDHGTSSNELLRKADIALYRAKSEQGSCFLTYDPSMEVESRRRQVVLEDLRHALKLGQFRIFYQPLVNSSSGKTCSYEALLRWMHPQHGMISPAEFIPLAEENGLISSIGEWVLYQACRDAETWSESTTVSVNVSPRQFRDGSVPSIVEAALQASRLHPSRLVLEITESILLHETDANLEMLHRIRALGVVIALDDFGKGFSSLSYLQSFPFDKVKIDRSFVQHVGTSKQSEKILEAMTGLLSSLGISVTIEGVETEQQRDWLSRLNCQEMQGFLFGYPRPIEKFITQTSCS